MVPNNIASSMKESLLPQDDPAERTRMTTTTEDLALVLSDLLQRLNRRLRTRVGLVPNYFMTRGEASKVDSLTTLGRKTAEKTFKLFHQKDFREDSLYNDFDDVIKTIGRVDEPSLRNEISEILNRRTRQGSVLHLLVQRRHLRFLRTLLLNANGLLDLEQHDHAGYSPKDLAWDRLEVEMVYLLLLHGALTERGNPRNSLGYAHWVGYDMMLNLDTGRWLHKHSEQAIMEHAHTVFTPPFREDLLQWTKGEVMDEQTLEQLGRIPRLFAIVLADGCDAITNHEAWASLIRHLSFLRDKNVPPTNNEAAVAPAERVEAVPCTDLYVFLNDLGVDTSEYRTAGRTVFFSKHRGEGEIAVKFSKSFEDEKTPHPLVKEASMNRMIGEFKQAYGLKSDYPENVKLLRLSSLPTEIRESVYEQQARGYHPFQLSADEDGVTALVYRAPEGYSQYINDPSLTIEEFQSGLEKASYDAAVLARHGLYHGTLVDIQHDSSREQRPHLWSFESFLTRFRGGAGRIEKGFASTAAPNVRRSGLADLKHILTEDRIPARFDPSVIHAQHNVLYNDEERNVVAVIEQTGASVFATALLAASSWQARHNAGMSENIHLAEELHRCFATFLRGFLHLDAATADHFLELIGTDFDLMAAQVEMFATDRYVHIAEQAPRRPIFGVCARVAGYASHPTAWVHFAQRGSLDVTSPTAATTGRSLPEIRQCFPATARVDTSMMRSSPTWVRGQGWVNRQGQAHLGSYEGVLPFQQLIQVLYATVYLAWLVRRHGRDSFSF